MRTMKEILKTMLFAVKFVIATIAVIFLFGEEAPDAQLSLVAFLGIKLGAIAIKLGAIATFYLLYKDFLFCGRHNLLPFFCVDYCKELINPDSDADRV